MAPPARTWSRPLVRSVTRPVLTQFVKAYPGPYSQWQIGEEDGLPAEGLGQDTADRRSQCPAYGRHGAEQPHGAARARLGHQRWWVLALLARAGVALGGVAVRLAARCDVGSALLRSGAGTFRAI